MEVVEDAAAPPGDRGAALREAVVVYAVATGPFLLRLSYSLATRGFVAVDIGGGRLIGTLTTEFIATALLVPWLARRGWRLGVLARQLAARDVLRGAGLWLLATVASFASTVAWWNVVPGTIGALNATRPYGSISMGLLVAVTLLNPVFEEFLFLGFGIAGLERVSLRLACVVSIVLRAIIHLYQGMAAIVGVLPIGVVFTLYFAKTRRIWPPIVAHVIMDALALTVLNGLYR